MANAIRAELDEVLAPGEIYSRRPRIRAEGIELRATRSGDGLVCPLCRRLIEAGHSPETPMEVYRGSTLALWVTSLGAGAALTIKEGNRGGKPRLVPYQPYEGPEGEP